MQSLTRSHCLLLGSVCGFITGKLFTDYRQGCPYLVTGDSDGRHALYICKIDYFKEQDFLTAMRDHTKLCHLLNFGKILHSEFYDLGCQNCSKNCPKIK